MYAPSSIGRKSGLRHTIHPKYDYAYIQLIQQYGRNLRPIREDFDRRLAEYNNRQFFVYDTHRPFGQGRTVTDHCRMCGARWTVF